MSGRNLEYVYKTISSGIDSKKFKLNSTSKNYGLSFVEMFTKKFGSMPSGNHRLIGHWGFEGAIPFNQEPYKTNTKNTQKYKCFTHFYSYFESI
jgi:hypothetical protein